jgi:hypothetical protein
MMGGDVTVTSEPGKGPAAPATGLKFKNPAAPAVKREAEEDWDKRG